MRENRCTIKTNFTTFISDKQQQLQNYFLEYEKKNNKKLSTKGLSFVQQ